jgi:hypothetical protein
MTEDSAKEVEAALIDAYPGLSNIQSGYDDQRGVMHAVEVIAEYEAPIAEPKHRLLLVNVSRSLANHHNLIDAVRFAWKIDPKKASAADYVLAVRRGLIIGAFIAVKWILATKENFAELYFTREGYGPREGRYGFLGREAPKEIIAAYYQKRVPERKKGEANPIRYWNLEI